MAPTVTLTPSGIEMDEVVLGVIGEEIFNERSAEAASTVLGAPLRK